MEIKQMFLNDDGMGMVYTSTGEMRNTQEFYWKSEEKKRLGGIYAWMELV
jgi:hypothetical protein